MSEKVKLLQPIGKPEPPLEWLRQSTEFLFVLQGARRDRSCGLRITCNPLCNPVCSTVI